MLMHMEMVDYMNHNHVCSLKTVNLTGCEETLVLKIVHIEPNFGGSRAL